MAKRFTTPTINWAQMEKLVPPDQKPKFFAFKAKADAYLRRVQANPAKPPKINWKEYKKIVPVSGLVDKLKEGYAGYKVPYPDDKLTATVDEQWKKMQPDIKEFCALVQKDMDAATIELDKIKAMPRFEDTTLEMFKDLYPKEALDPVNRPTFWPHNPEEQLGYKPPEHSAPKDVKKK